MIFLDAAVNTDANLVPFFERGFSIYRLAFPWKERERVHSILLINVGGN